MTMNHDLIEDMVQRSRSTDVIRDETRQVYMERYYMDDTLDIRLHHIMRSDSDRDLHDHPWDFTSLILEGTYIETLLDGSSTQYVAGDVLRHSASTAHRLTLPTGPVWTYVVTGPVRRNWGFHLANHGGWMSAHAYLEIRNRKAVRG